MISVRPLHLATVDQLGPRGRTCVYWQTDDRSGLPMREDSDGRPGPASTTESTESTDDGGPAEDGAGAGSAGANGAAGYWRAVRGTAVGDPEFEKEAWISRVALEWGVCGQVARYGDRAAGAAFYAPPAMVPRSDCFPTSPVGSDAVLLAGLIEEHDAPAGVRTALLGEVVTDLRARGIKAIETFGVTSRDTGSITSRDGCGADSCVAPSSFLVEHGFTVVAEHETHPRLRLEIESEHQWKADVEHALDQLFAEQGLATRRTLALTGASLRTR